MFLGAPNVLSKGVEAGRIRLGHRSYESVVGLVVVGNMVLHADATALEATGIYEKLVVALGQCCRRINGVLGSHPR